MSISSPLGFHDHQPFSGISDELVYGVQPDGTIVHISMVDRGLACNCRCPACDHVLVAKKSAKQTHYFEQVHNVAIWPIISLTIIRTSVVHT